MTHRIQCNCMKSEVIIQAFQNKKTLSTNSLNDLIGFLFIVKQLISSGTVKDRFRFPGFIT